MKVKYKPKLWFRLKDFIQQLHFNQFWGPLDFTACSLLTVVTFISPFRLFIEHFHFIQHHFWPKIVLKCGMPVQGYFKGLVHRKMLQKILLFAHSHVVPNLYEFLSYVEFKRRYFEKCIFCSYNKSQWGSAWFETKNNWNILQISSFVFFTIKQVKEV